MSNFILSCLVCTTLFAAPLATAILPHPELFERENRRLWPFPDWPKTWEQKQFLRYFGSIDRFFPDRFPLRERLLELARTPCQLLGESPDFEQPFRGKNDFLFAGATLNKLQGMTTPSAEEVLRTCNKFMALNEAFRAIGAEFVIFLGPDKKIIYPDKLPDIVRPAKTRYIQPLIDTVHDARIRLYDPTERLLRKKREKLLYYKTDTHWNILGAFEAFKDFSRHMGLPSLPDFEIQRLPGPHREGNLSIMAGFSNYPISG